MHLPVVADATLKRQTHIKLLRRKALTLVAIDTFARGTDLASITAEHLVDMATGGLECKLAWTKEQRTASWTRLVIPCSCGEPAPESGHAEPSSGSMSRNRARHLDKKTGKRKTGKKDSSGGGPSSRYS